MEEVKRSVGLEELGVVWLEEGEGRFKGRRGEKKSCVVLVSRS